MNNNARIFNKIMSVVLALVMVLSMLPMSVFAAEATQTDHDVGEQTAAVETTADEGSEIPTEGYELTIRNADGSEGMTIDGTKSASDFCLKSAIEDARAFTNNAFLFGLTTPCTYVVEMYEDSYEDESFEIGADVTINGNGFKIVCAEGVEVTNNGSLNDAEIVGSAPAAPAVELNAQTVAGTITFEPVTGDSLSYVLGRLEISSDLFPLAGGISIVEIDVSTDVVEVEPVTVKYSTVISGTGSVSGTIVVAEGGVLKIESTVGTDNLTVTDAEGNEMVKGEDGTFAPAPAKLIEVTDAEGNVTYLENFRGFNTSNVSIKLLADVGDYNLNLDKATGVVLDLNGYTFSKQINLNNGAELTIKDSSDAKTGKVIVDKETNDTYAAVIIMRGTLTVEGGTIETTGTTGAIQASLATLNIEGGKIVSQGNGVELGTWAVSNTKYPNTVTMTGGEIEAAGKGIVDSDKCVGTTVSIEGGVINSTGDSLSITTGTAAVTGGTFSTDVSAYAADGFEVKANADGTYGVAPAAPAGLSGTGTEADPFLVTNIDELKWFRDAVNGGETYDNQFVKLTADVDLNGESWTPIGNATNKFLGTFDGAGHTISDLVVDVDTNNAGLFGFASVIKNVTIDNATVSGVVCVGALVGELESSVGTVDNCHVTGIIKITGENSVGGLAGKGYANIKNCSVDGTDAEASFVLGVAGTTEEGDNVGGIIGHLGEGNTLGVANSTARNITVSGTRKVGGIVGTIARGNDLVGNTAENLTVECTATADYAADNASTTTIGGIVGNYFGSATSGGILQDSTVTNVTLVPGNATSAGALVGGDRVNNGGAPDGVEASGSTVTNVTGATNSYLLPAVAKIGDVEYATLEAAIAAAEAGDVIEILANEIVFDENAASIVVDKAVTIDGNDAALKFNSAASAFVVKSSNVTFMDMTVEQGTKDNSFGISIAKGAWDAPAVQYANVTIRNVDFVGGDYALCLIGENVVVDDCSFTGQDSHNIIVYSLKGDSKITDNYFAASKGNNKSAILWEGGADSATDLSGFIGGGNLTVSGNTAVGKGVFFQFTNWGLVKGMNVTITKNEVDAFTNKAIALYDMDGAVEADGDEFASFTVTENIFTNVPEGRPIVKEYTGTVAVDASANYLGSAEPDHAALLVGDKVTVKSYYADAGMTDLVEIVDAVAEVNGVKYATLEEAFKAATDGCTIEILADVTVDYKWDCRDYVADGSHSQFKESVTINGNGHTIEFTGTVSDGNWSTIFRFEEDATVNDLTVDISEATGVQRVITAKKSLSVDNLTIIGSAKYGVIFGEGAAAADLAAAEIVIKNSALTGTRRAISDNEGGKDVKSAVITGNKLDANVYVSASESIQFTGNTTAGEVDLRSYTAGNSLNVEATGNTLTAGVKNYIEAGGTVDAQPEFTLPATGTVTPAYVGEADGYVRVWGEGGGNAKESMKLELYSGDELMATTELNNVGGILNGTVYVTWNFYYPESNDEYWTTTWEEGHPNPDAQPTKVVLYVDGEAVAENVAKMSGPDDLNPVVWAELGGVKVGLQGSGTEEDPYQIGTAEELFLFAKKVNDGTYKGVYAVLTNNIDLEQEEWTSIGTSANPFTGTFDGKGYTISNIWSYDRGLFGYTSTGNYVDSGKNGHATIKDLTLNGVEVYNQSTSAVGGLVGQAGQNTEIDNVTVTGYVSIYGYSYVGGLVGQGYVHVNDCHVVGVDSEEGGKSTIDANYWAVAGIVGHAGSEGGSSITNCSVKNVTIDSVYYGAGSIAGVGTTGTIENVSAEDVSIVAGSEPDENGLLVGCNYDKITGDCSVKNVVLTVAGTEVTNPQDMAASIGDSFYVTLQAAIDAAEAGDTVVLLNDVVLTEGVIVAADKVVTLDLNGKTISRNTEAAVGTAAVTNNGTLTIQDSGTGGKITAFAANPDTAEIPDYASNTITNCGVLTVKGGTIENSTGDNARAAFPIDNNSTSRDAIVNIEGGTVSGRGAIRQFANSTTYANEVNITGGTVSGSSYAVWVQNPGSGDPKAELNISDDAVVGKILLSPSANFEPAISGGTVDEVAIWDADTANPERNPSGFITGGIFKKTFADEPLAEGYAALPDLNGCYVVGEAPTAIVNASGATVVPETEYGVWDGSFTEGSGDMPLSFVMQFLAVQDEDDMATSPFAEWYGDFVLTFTGIENGSFDTDGCYLAGYYGDWGWIKVPVEGVLDSVEEGVRYPVMLGVGLGQKYDYICTGVKDFRCALYLTDEILAANPDLQVKLELSVVDNSKGGDAAANALASGENIYEVNSHVYDAEDFVIKVELPEVEITDITGNLTDSDPDLTFALNFAIKDADKLTEEYLEKLFAQYGDWYTDYVLTISGLTDDDVTFNANGGADGYLAGQYDAWSENWVSVPFEDVVVNDGEGIYIMEYAAKLMNQPGLRFTLQEIAEIVVNFDCGVYFEPEFLLANPDMKVDLELKVFTTDADGNIADEISVATNEFKAADVVIETGLTGKGTEAEPYMIMDLDDLILFRDSVNAGETKYNAKGVYVALGADIDMAEVDWSVNIGDGANVSFDGIFDGNDHVLKNLTAIETAQVADGYICSGLFGCIGGSAVVKNLTIENVTIDCTVMERTGNAATEPHNVGVIVGFAWFATGSVENVKVTGDIKIDAPKVDGVGGIVGYDYYGELTVKDCSVVGNDGSYITGAAYVGGVIGYASSNSNISGNTVENVDITGKSCVGGVAGLMLGSGKAVDNTVKNVELTATHENWQNSAAAVIGTISGGGVTVSGSTVEGVNATALVGSEWVNKPTAPVGKVEAKVGDTYYATWEAALAAAEAGETVELLADVTVEGTAQIPAAITLKSNGYTVNGSIRMLGDLTLDGALTITGGLWVGKIGETLTATLSGDKLTASYFMFQCGSYVINADIDAVYGYLSYEGVFEVNSTIHTTGTNGEVLYINGKVNLNVGAALDSDNSVFLCEDNAVLTIMVGAKVDSNLSITAPGAQLKLDATGMAAGEYTAITGEVTNSDGGTISVINNDSLTAELQSGKIVLIGETLFDFAKVNMRMGENLSLIFYFKQDCITDTDLSDYVAKISVDYKDERSVVSSEIAASEWAKTSDEYVVEVSGLAAKEMADDVTITICKGDEAVSMTRSMSLRTYGELVLKSSTNDKFKTTVVDMLNYGAKAQEYFEYNTGDLANSGIDSYQSLATANDAVQLGMKNELISGTKEYLANFNMRFVSDITMIFGVTADCAAENAKITFVNHLGKSVETVAEEFAVATDAETGKQQKMFEFAGMVVADIDQVIKVEFFDADGNSLLALNSSVNAYLTKVQADSSDEKMKELGMEFGKFAVSAHAYLHRNDK